MKRASAAGLILGIVVLTGLGLAGALVRFKTCTSCDGLAQHILMRTSPTLGPIKFPRVGCPDCADRGKISLFKSWMRPSVASSIAAVVRGLRNAGGRDTLRALDLVVRESGPAYARFLKQYPPHIDVFRKAEFVEVDQRTYLVLIAESGVHAPKEPLGLLVILLSVEGRALDFVDLSTATWEGSLWPRILPEEAGVVIDRKPVGGPEDELSLRMIRWNEIDREIQTRGAEACRLRIRADRLELIEK